MTPPPDLGEPEALSALIGAICDCAVDPDRWTPTIGRICAALDLVASRPCLFDRAQGRTIFARGWGEAPQAMPRLVEHYAADAAALQNATLARRSGEMDDPMVLSRDVPDIFAAARITREWARPLGHCDGITLVVLQDGPRIGVFAATRHDSVGPVTEREVRLMRLLAPDIRRAVAIGSILDMRALHAATLESTLDQVSAGICMVDPEGAVLHANAAARRMLEGAGPVLLRQGRIAARAPKAGVALRAAIAAAAAPAAEAGPGVPLGEAPDAPAIARVLPLPGGSRRGLAPRAAAALSIAAPPGAAAPDLPGLAAQFALTPAEARLFGLLLAGVSLAEAATALGLALPMAKTRLARLFQKTGTTRQVDLLGLAARLTPPARR